MICMDFWIVSHLLLAHIIIPIGSGDFFDDCWLFSLGNIFEREHWGLIGEGSGSNRMFWWPSSIPEASKFGWVFSFNFCTRCCSVSVVRHHSHPPLGLDVVTSYTSYGHESVGRRWIIINMDICYMTVCGHTTTTTAIGYHHYNHKTP